MGEGYRGSEGDGGGEGRKRGGARIERSYYVATELLCAVAKTFG